MISSASAPPSLSGPLRLPRYAPRRVSCPDGVTVAVQDWAPAADHAPLLDLLLIHGYSQAHPCWLHQVRAPLAQRCRLVSYDLRGHGDSDKPLAPEYYQEPARWAGELHAVIGQLGLRRPVLIAWSYGGRVLMDYLSTYGADELAGLVFLSAATRADAQVIGRGGEALLRAMSDVTDAQSNRGATEAMLRACVSRPLSSEELEYMLSYNLKCPPQIRGYLRGRPAHYDAVLRRLRLPALVVHGELDPINLPAMAAYTASRVRGARTVMYPGVGHLPFWEVPERFNADLAQFLAEIRAAT